jgi:hypothetical protein
MYAGGASIGRGLMQAAGVEDPEMAASNKLKAAAAQVQQQGLDPKTSAGMKAVADIIQQSGDTATAMKAMVVANQLAQNEAQLGKTKAETIKALRDPRDNLVQQVLTSGKYTPASVSAFKDSQNPADLVFIEPKAEMLDTGSKKEIGKAESLNTVLIKSNKDLDKYITDIEDNKLSIGLGASATKLYQGFTGTQNENTLRLESLKKFIERERNNILMAAKGTQTEGDAERALSQILSPTNWTSSNSMVNALKDLKQYKQDQVDANTTLINSLSGSRKVGAQQPAKPALTGKAIYSAVRNKKGWEDASDAEIESAIKSGKIKVGSIK